MTDRPESEVARRARAFETRGWFPVRWAHHPEEIKRVFRRCRWRPIGKQCFRNAQRLVVDEHENFGDARLEYVEGVAFGVIPFPHAWVRLDGVDHDVTIDSGEVQLVEGRAYPLDRVYMNLITTRSFCRVDADWLNAAMLRAMGLDEEKLRLLDELNRALSQKGGLDDGP